MMLMICFSLNSRSGRLLRHVPREEPLSAHALRCKDTQKVDNQGRVVNFFEQKSAFSSGRRILLSSTAFHTHPLRENLQCSQKILRCLQKIAQCLQESRQRQMPQKEIGISLQEIVRIYGNDTHYLLRRNGISLNAVLMIHQQTARFSLHSWHSCSILSPNTNCTNLSNLFRNNNSKRR